MAYTTINKSGDYFNTKLYTGNGSTQSITGVGFQPDFTWLKSRNNTYDNFLYDAVRGQGKYLQSNRTSVEGDTDQMTSFDSDGYTVGVTGGVATNGSGSTMASWNWKANGAGSANTDGDIASTVSVNTTAGFSIVSYVGGGTQDLTVGHGLGTTPDMIIVKNRSIAEEWRVWHSSLSGSTYKLSLNGTGAEDSSSTVFNGQSSTTFTVGTDPSVNGNGNNIIAYCFNSVKGYSKFGSYAGNQVADGTFVYLGFKPAFVMIKRYSAGNPTATGWNILDNKRDPENVMDTILQPNNSNADANDSNKNCDFLSNGFKIRGTSAETNNSGHDYIYMAFAEKPLVGSNNVPCTAR